MCEFFGDPRFIFPSELADETRFPELRLIGEPACGNRRFAVFLYKSIAMIDPVKHGRYFSLMNKITQIIRKRCILAERPWFFSLFEERAIPRRLEFHRVGHDSQ